MKDFEINRSALFVPGNRPDRVDKAVATAADMIIIDLEDAVPAADKIAVRSVVKEKIDQYRNRKLMVRVNDLDTGLTEGDLNIIVRTGLDMVMLPKVQRAGDVRHMADLMLSAEKAAGIDPGSLGLVALVETALGVENAFDIAGAQTDIPRLQTLAFGAADFSLDMDIQISKTGEELAFPRARIALGCRAGGIDQPLDTPFMIDLKDPEAFETDVQRGKNLGFGGKLCIHPNQVDVCNRIFAPSEKEIVFSGRVVKAFETAEAAGQAAIQVDGKFIDYPVVARARKILKIAERINALA